MSVKAEVTELRATGTEGAVISIPQLNVQSIGVVVMGVTPLLCDALTDKVKRDLQAQSEGSARAPGKQRSKKKDWTNCVYRLPNGDGYGFPIEGFSSGIIRGAKQVRDQTMKDIPGAFTIRPYANDFGSTLVRIWGDGPECFETFPRDDKGIPHASYKAIFKKWFAAFQIDITLDLLTPAQLMDCIKFGGQQSGIGCMRPDRKRSYGKYRPCGIADPEFLDLVSNLKIKPEEVLKTISGDRVETGYLEKD